MSSVRQKLKFLYQNHISNAPLILLMRKKSLSLLTLGSLQAKDLQSM